MCPDGKFPSLCPMGLESLFQAQFVHEDHRHPLFLGDVRFLKPCLGYISCQNRSRCYLVFGCAELQWALRDWPVVPELKVGCFCYLAALPVRLANRL